jgi:uncharacterized membrane protein
VLDARVARSVGTGRRHFLQEATYDRHTILPAHIEETIQAIANLHANHHAESGSLQRSLDKATDWLGQPRSIALMVLLVGLWIGGNCIVLANRGSAWDLPPFGWLQTVLGSLAFFVALVILATQRWADHMAEHREQLTLELAILCEQKSAKIISLLEEMRRDNPMLRNRIDEAAAAMAVAAHPQAVLDAIKESHGTWAADALSEFDALSASQPEMTIKDKRSVDHIG